MDDYTPTATSEKFRKVANQLSLAAGQAFSRHINLSHEEECARWGLIQVCSEVVCKAILSGELSERSFQDMLDRFRDSGL